MRHALAGVGENLRDHYAPRFTARVKNIDTINERARGLKLAREVIRYATTRKGILALNPTLIYCFWRSVPAYRPRTCSSPSRRRATGRACRASSTSSPA